MRDKPFTITVFTGAVAIALWSLVVAGQQPGASATLPLEPIRERGQSVTGAYEGWYKNQDGSFTMLVGYFNRNRVATVDIPIGPNNRLEPGGPDRGQPTHFLPRRQWGVFTINVPAGFGNQKVVWTLVANGEKNEIPLTLHQNYEVMPFKDPAMGNTPPVLRFELNGPSFQGPPVSNGPARAAVAGRPTPFELFARDDAHEEPGGNPQGRGGKPPPPVTVLLSKFRGPGTVTFTNPRPEVAFGSDGRASTTATFSAPGDYLVRVQANDRSGDGGGGFQCCWTNVHVPVKVTGAP